MGRARHSWDPSLSTRGPDGTWTSRCKHCRLETREGWYSQDGRVLHVDQWWTPAGRLLRIRPAVHFDAPAAAPPLEAAFPDVEVGGVPECPKTPDAWAVPSTS